MKTPLLLMGTALLCGITGFAQTNHRAVVNNKQVLQKTGIVKKDAVAYFPEKHFKPSVNNNNKVQAPPYKLISSSHNGYTLLESKSNCVTYNKAINTVAFTHRKTPLWDFTGANSGSIETSWTSNNGASWDSTIVYFDSVNYARYPSGALWNPTGNTSPANARAVVMGPETDGSTWPGNYFAFGPLTPSAVNTTGGLYVPNHVPNTANGNSIGGAFGFAQFDVQEAGGKIWGLANIVANPDGATNVAFGFRGAAMINGSSSNGTSFVWKSDSIIPAFMLDPTGANEALSAPQLAFSQDGQTGYLVFLGIEAGATGSRRAYQPIVYKTSNGGTSWAQVNTAYDWAAGANSCLMGSIAPVKTSATLLKPFFSQSLGADAVVDNSGKLHFICTVASGSSDHVDSLGYTYNYDYAGYYPYIWDFVTDGTGTWTEYFVDSLLTSDLDATQTENPWADGAGAKMPYDNRLQASRTTDGSRIFVGWMDSDPAFTASIFNSAPDAFVKAINPANFNMSARTNMSNNVQNIYWMFMSNITAEPSAGQYQIPFTYSGSTNFDMTLAIDHYYIDDAIMSDAAINQPYWGCAYTGINTNTGAIESVAQNFPNPFDNNTSIKVTLKSAEDIKVSIYNTMGQLVNYKAVKGVNGVNNINIEAANLVSGVYFYSINVNGNVVTKKMTVQK